MSRRISPVIPGFGLTLGYTLVYLSLLVLIPLGAMFLKTTQLSWEQFWAIISAPRVLAALKLSFGTALAAAVLNGLIGTLLAWVLVRYEFPGRKIIDAMIDLPFSPYPPPSPVSPSPRSMRRPAWSASSPATSASRSPIPPWGSPWR